MKTPSIEDIAQKINNLDTKKIAVILLFSVLICYSDIAFIMMFQVRSLKRVSAKNTKLKTDIRAVSLDLERMRDKGKTKKAEAKEKKILAEGQLPFLLQQIYSSANSNKVSILQVKPFRESKDTKSQGVTVAAAAKLAAVFMSLEVSSDYHHLGTFINDLENGQEFIAVEELKIMPNSANYMQQKATLLLKTYVTK